MSLSGSDYYRLRGLMNKNILKLVLSAMFLAIALLLPFLTGQIPQVGKMLLPMHIPVILCGFICGWEHGTVVGYTAPLFRGLIFSNPIFFPTGIIMAFELAAYGAFAGLIYNKIKCPKIPRIYLSLLSSMVLGRLVKCVVQFVVLGFTDEGFVFSAFIAGAFVNAVPGIIVQLVLIPIVMFTLEKTRLIPIKERKKNNG